MPKIPKKKKEAVYAFWGAYPDELATESGVLAAKFEMTPKEISSLKGTYHRLLKEGRMKPDVVVTTPPAVSTASAKTTVTSPPNPRGTTENLGGLGQSRDVGTSHVEQVREAATPLADREAPAPVAPVDDLQTLNAKFDGATKEIATLKSMMGDYFKGREGDGGPAPAKIEVDEGSLVARTLHLTPKTLMLFDIAVSDGYPGALSEYINDVVANYYKKRGLALGLIERRVIE